MTPQYELKRPRARAGRAMLLAFSTLACLPLAAPAFAQSAGQDAQLQSVEKQIQALQTQLRQMRQENVQRAAAAAQQAQQQAAREQALQAQIQAQPAAVQTAAAIPAGSVAVTSPGKGKFTIGGVTITLGGFVEMAGEYRTSNMSSDIATSWNAIPFRNTPAAHEGEFRASARQSRMSMLVQGNVGNGWQAGAYGEVDFLGAAPTANSNESNSYTPRLRVGYLQLDQTNGGLHILAGQSWSLVTPTRVGITARTELSPLTIDAQPVPGFTWTRQPQFRVADDFDNHQFWVAASLEAPQATFTTGPNGTGAAGTITVNNPGGQNFAPTTNYSADVAPDLVVKFAADPGWGHYEAFGVGRLIQDRQSFVGTGNNKTVLAGGGGADMLLPLIPGMLDFQANALVGEGIGRYGSAQLPDATVGANGAPVPIPEVEAMVGLVGHPAPSVDLYGYGGVESESKKAFTSAGKGFGYGSPLYSNVGCDTELSASTCVGNTSSVAQGTIGGSWRFLQGNFGTMQAGLQYSYTRRDTFKGVGGAPHATENEFLASLRYYPFQ